MRLALLPLMLRSSSLSASNAPSWSASGCPASSSSFLFAPEARRFAIASGVASTGLTRPTCGRLGWTGVTPGVDGKSTGEVCGASHQKQTVQKWLNSSVSEWACCKLQPRAWQTMIKQIHSRIFTQIGLLDIKWDGKHLDVLTCDHAWSLASHNSLRKGSQLLREQRWCCQSPKHRRSHRVLNATKQIDLDLYTSFVCLSSTVGRQSYVTYLSCELGSNSRENSSRRC